MKINLSNISFKSSRLNICSLADTHGDILGIPQVIKTIQDNQDDIFEKKEEKSTQNIFTIVGDFYMNPGGKGSLTHPRERLGDIQNSFLQQMVASVKKCIPPQGKFETIYTPGNHCFGAGDAWLFDKLFTAPMTSLISNINLLKSPLFAKFVRKFDNFETEKIYTIPDNKNPKIKNHVLFLGVTIPSMYYNMHNIKHITFYDQTTKNEVNFTKKDFAQTIDLLNDKIKKFKKKYPKGAVVVNAHIGNELSNMLAENVKNIDLILNAHDHKDYTSLIGKTQILSHGQNCQFVRNINLIFDDNGKLSKIKSQKYDTSPYIKEARKDPVLSKFVTSLLKKDLVPLAYIEKNENTPKDFVFHNGIRYKNNILANYITTGIKEAVVKKYPDVDVVGIPSTIIRSGLLSNTHRSTFNNIDLINMFQGVDTNVSGLRIGTVSGKELLELVGENVKNNLKSPTRNALILWSDIQINKTGIENSILKKDFKASKNIKIRNQITGKFTNINPEKKYKILLADKYLVKKTADIKVPSMIIKKFKRIPEIYPQLFKEYLEDQKGKVVVTDKVKENRIL